MTSRPVLPGQSAAVLELALNPGDMRGLDWLNVVRAGAAAGIRRLVLTGPHPTRHPAAQALWECGVSYGMNVCISATPDATTDLSPRVRITANGMPHLVLPDPAGIAVTDLVHILGPGPGLAFLAGPPAHQALEAAARQQNLLELVTA